jgi:hypothetical protein
MMTPLAQRADYRSTAYLPTERDDHTIADGLLYLRLAALRTDEDCARLVGVLGREELAQYGPYASSAPRP